MPDFKFSKTDRLLKRSQFVLISAKGEKIRNRFFTVLYVSGETSKTRIGITVTKRIGNSVTRNRIKRLIREYFRLNRSNIKGIWDINIIAGKHASQLSSQELFLSLKDIFRHFSQKHD